MNFINLRSVFNRKVRAKNPLLFIYKTVTHKLKKATAQTAHLFFSTAKANAKKIKELFSANAQNN